MWCIHCSESTYNKEISLEQFYKDITYKSNDGEKKERCYKLTCKSEKHMDIQYHDGLIEDVLPFNPKGYCSPGGLYFITESQLPYYRNHSNWIWIREVIFYDPTTPDNQELSGVRIYKEEGKYKANKFYLLPRQPFKNIIKFVNLQNKKICLRSLEIDPFVLKTNHKNLLTDREYKKYCLKYSYCLNLQYINPKRLDKNTYYNICIEWVESRGINLKYVKPRYLTKKMYENICNIAFNSKNKGGMWASTFIKWQYTSTNFELNLCEKIYDNTYSDNEIIKIWNFQEKHWSKHKQLYKHKF